MMTTSVIVGITRQGRFSEKPAQWILELLHKRKGTEASRSPRLPDALLRSARAPGHAGPPDGMSRLSAIASVSMYRRSSRWLRPKTLTTKRGGQE